MNQDDPTLAAGTNSSLSPSPSPPSTDPADERERELTAQFNAQLAPVVRMLQQTPRSAPDPELEWRREVENRLVASGFPRRLMQVRNLRRDPPGQEWLNARDVLRGLVLDHGMICMMVGPRGTGKTLLAVWIARHVALQGKGVGFIRCARLFERIRASRHNRSDQNESQVMSRFLKPRLLVIDELGERADTKAEDRVLHNLICERYDDGNDTVVVTNQSRKAALDSLGESIQSRMVESGGLIECTWTSFRAKPDLARDLPTKT